MASLACLELVASAVIAAVALAAAVVAAIAEPFSAVVACSSAAVPCSGAFAAVVAGPCSGYRAACSNPCHLGSRSCLTVLGLGCTGLFLSGVW